MQAFEFKRIRVNILKLDQETLAKKLDRHVVQISKYENGRAPIPSAIATLMRLYSKEAKAPTSNATA